MSVSHRSKRENIRGLNFFQHRPLRQRTEQIDSRRKIQALDLRLEHVAQRTIANDIADEIESAPRNFAAGVDEVVEPLECHKPAHADDARHMVGRDRRARRLIIWPGKAFEVESVVNTVNFRGGIRTALAKKLTAVIGLSRDEFRRGADFSKEIIAAEVFHEILPMRGDAEWNARNFFQE